MKYLLLSLTFSVLWILAISYRFTVHSILSLSSLTKFQLSNVRIGVTTIFDYHLKHCSVPSFFGCDKIILIRLKVHGPFCVYGVVQLDCDGWRGNTDDVRTPSEDSGLGLGPLESTNSRSFR